MSATLLPAIPKTRAEIDALPYVPSWGHWSVQAWDKRINDRPPQYHKLAEVEFPVVNGCGPFVSDEVARRSFANLDAIARAALVAPADGNAQ